MIGESIITYNQYINNWRPNWIRGSVNGTDGSCLIERFCMSEIFSSKMTTRYKMAWWVNLWLMRPGACCSTLNSSSVRWRSSLYPYMLPPHIILQPFSASPSPGNCSWPHHFPVVQGALPLLDAWQPFLFAGNCSQGCLWWANLFPEHCRGIHWLPLHTSASQ